MLVLGRRPEEYIVINDNIIVKVIKSEDGHLRLGIEAPREVSIVRGEIYEKQQQLK
ncbi:carbon storage regulator [Bacillus coahuilensis m2-6]|uniref:carbon storage regulator n=1 Tax=Bacillus coahuilensis TaxID=408580 RepID=UPI0001851348|nr:carbon storage regulator [Bacillus coahuilensis]KUP05703.1 carbon storage regulator [Bacillus coahuilensis m2-6]